jgi:uncharacterized protein (TIGR00297 family)
MQLILHLSVGFLLAALIGYVAYRRQSLSASGVVGAIITGTIIFGLGGLAWGVLLIVFFVSSSALSHYKEGLKESLAEKFSKGGRRDLAQTFANGGAGALIVVANLVWPHPVWWAAFAGAMATVNSDTWATELGVLSQARPRLITTGHQVEAGTSGGISWMGSWAALAGAALIALFAASAKLLGALFAGSPGSAPAPIALAGVVFALLILTSGAGLLGSLFDSLLGASVQAIYYCDACAKETERYPAHRCGRPTRPLRGWRWLDNDWVNFLSSVLGAAVAAGAWLALMGWR